LILGPFDLGVFLNTGRGVVGQASRSAFPVKDLLEKYQILVIGRGAGEGFFCQGLGDGFIGNG